MYDNGIWKACTAHYRAGHWTAVPTSVAQSTECPLTFMIVFPIFVMRQTKILQVWGGKILFSAAFWYRNIPNDTQPDFIMMQRYVV